MANFKKHFCRHFHRTQTMNLLGVCRRTCHAFRVLFFISNSQIKIFVYLELDLKHVWDMNLASDFDAGYANFSA